MKKKTYALQSDRIKQWKRPAQLSTTPALSMILKNLFYNIKILCANRISRIQLVITPLFLNQLIVGPTLNNTPLF